MGNLAYILLDTHHGLNIFNMNFDPLQLKSNLIHIINIKIIHYQLILHLQNTQF